MIALIATRREFLKLTAAVTAGMVLRPAARKTLFEDTVFEGVECPVPFEVGGRLFVQRLRPGDSILGPVLICQWDVFGDTESQQMNGLSAELVRPDYQLVLLRADVTQYGNYKWESRPGAEIMVPERGEVVFKCSSPRGEGAVCFEKLT